MLAKEEYLKTVKRPYPPLFTSLVCMGYHQRKYFEGLLKEPYAFLNIVHVNSIWYYSKKEVEDGGKLALESWKEEKFFQYVKEEFRKREETLVKAAKKDITSFCNAYMGYMPALALVFAVEKQTEVRLREALSKKLSSKKTDELISELNNPLQDNFYKKEEYDLVRTKNIEKHVKNYEWILARYGDEKRYTIEEAREKLKRINKTNFFKKWKENKQKLKRIIISTKKLLGQKSYLVDIFQYIIFYRTQRTDVMNKSAFLAIPLFKKTAEIFRLTYNELLYCSASEILDRKIPSKEVLKERMEDCSTILHNGNLMLIIGKESRRIKDFLKTDNIEANEIKGNTACQGKVTGIVKIVDSSKDFSKVNKGDILVTSITTPDMIMIMHKAAAFVTNEGGITCHAAIVSREMKKPCIVGTEIATKVLKEGDLVEVDATAGTVKKILKKAL